MIDLFGRIRPASVRIDASTVCQLRCPTCPTASGEIAARLGSGFLKPEDFRRLLDENPYVTDVELSNRGEVFLNPRLIQIMQDARERGVRLHAGNGANLNTMSDELIEALVRYQLRSITCSIDGADDATYRLYRRGGNFDRVIGNIRKINELKKRYDSPYPALLWQYVAFGHNERSIEAARAMARELGMGFYVKIAWGDMYTDEAFSPVVDRALIGRETGLDVADRAEFHARYGVSYARATCRQLWKDPQINYDGRVLGCCINYKGDYGNAFEEGLVNVLNNEKMRYARRMLMGKSPARDDIPCTGCILYGLMNKDGRWLTDDETGASGPGLFRGTVARKASELRQKFL